MQSCSCVPGGCSLPCAAAGPAGRGPAHALRAGASAGSAASQRRSAVLTSSGVSSWGLREGVVRKEVYRPGAAQERRGVSPRVWQADAARVAARRRLRPCHLGTGQPRHSPEPPLLAALPLPTAAAVSPVPAVDVGALSGRVVALDLGGPGRHAPRVLQGGQSGGGAGARVRAPSPRHQGLCTLCRLAAPGSPPAAVQLSVAVCAWRGSSAPAGRLRACLGVGLHGGPPPTTPLPCAPSPPTAGTLGCPEAGPAAGSSPLPGLHAQREQPM